MDVSRVLVTGASGFIALHCMVQLLQKGFQVRASLRDEQRRAGVLNVLREAGIDEGDVDFVVTNLMSDDGWDDAVAGCRDVLHVASPFPMQQPRNRDDVIAPAREGTLRVLAAATRAGVRRVVVTSSIAAVMYPSRGEQSREYTEADWTDPDRGDLSAYVASKAIAERAAWDFAAATPNAPELVAVNPGFVMGPALSSKLSTSHELIRRLAGGQLPAVPRAGYPVVDVRDVAIGHVEALLRPGAAGERFLMTSGTMTLLEICRVIGATLPDLASRVPRWQAPDLAVRAASLFDASVKAVSPELGVLRTCSNAKARDMLEMTFRTPREAVASAALSLREHGLI